MFSSWCFFATRKSDVLNQIKRFLWPLTVILVVLYYFSLSWHYGCALDLLVAPIASIIAVIICSYKKHNCKSILYVGHNSLLFYVLQITYLGSLEIINSPLLYCIAVTSCIIICTLVYTTTSRLIENRIKK